MGGAIVMNCELSLLRGGVCELRPDEPSPIDLA
jgi:hypothetical protein